MYGRIQDGTVETWSMFISKGSHGSRVIYRCWVVCGMVVEQGRLKLFHQLFKRWVCEKKIFKLDSQANILGAPVLKSQNFIK